ncbi:hypothetical protein AURDEDRAFT_122346 [Auricularia subglabra TFB-10046 SS5]|nr:hypothetical protein AURDEDRAFT_122346 [Auricularia subglabra TFB-10046 SS5]
MSFVDLVRDLLRHEDDYASDHDVPSLLATISRCAPDLATDWAVSHSESVYKREMLCVTARSAGFHANASNLQPEQIEQFDLPAMAARLRERAPHLWNLFSIILNASGNRRRVVGHSERSAVVLDAGGDLGGQDDRIVLAPASCQPPSGSGGEAMDIDVAGDDVPESTEQTPAELHATAGKSRTDRTDELRAIHMFGIAQQSSNAQCNAVQTFMGIFMRTNRVPSMVISIPNHLGMVIGTDSIDKACESLAIACKERLALQGRSLRAQIAYDNFNFLERVAVPVAGRGNTFVSTISAILIQSHPCLTKEHFKAVALLWSKNVANEMPRFAPKPAPFTPSYMDILNMPYHLDPRAATDDFNPVEDQLETRHIRHILLLQGPGFASYSDLLGEPPEVLRIPLHKTE